MCFLIYPACIPARICILRIENMETRYDGIRVNYKLINFLAEFLLKTLPITAQLI